MFVSNNNLGSLYHGIPGQERDGRAIARDNSLPLHYPEDIFDECNRQYLKEHEVPKYSGYVAHGLKLLFGPVLVRRFSNLIAWTGIGEPFKAQRNYPLLGEKTEFNQIAKTYAPVLWTMSPAQSTNPSLKPCEIRYEILPPQEGKKYYSIIYNIKFPKEEMPIPIVGRIYEAAKSFLYGSKHHWEAIQVDIDQETKQPIGICFEGSNYSNNPESYKLISYKDLHLFVKISKSKEGTWIRTLQQHNGRIEHREVPNPFRENTHPNISITSWKASFDLYDVVKEKPGLHLSKLEILEPKFLDLETFRQEGIDLRMNWTNQRKFGKFRLQLPARNVSKLK